MKTNVITSGVSINSPMIGRGPVMVVIDMNGTGPSLSRETLSNFGGGGNGVTRASGIECAAAAAWAGATTARTITTWISNHCNNDNDLPPYTTLYSELCGNF